MMYGGIAINEYNEIYVKNNQDKANAMWLACPLSYQSLSYILYYGHIGGDGYYNAGIGFRPIVCLKSGTKLEKQLDGTYMIVK